MTAAAVVSLFPRQARKGVEKLNEKTAEYQKWVKESIRAMETEWVFQGSKRTWGRWVLVYGSLPKPRFQAFRLRCPSET